MSQQFDLDGETWEIGAEAMQARGNVRALVFHCVSNPQRPYRVVEVPVADADTGDIDARAAAALFARSQVMDFSHDTDAIDGAPPFGTPHYRG